MMADKYFNMYEFIGNLPEPKTKDEIAVTAFSDAIDDISITLSEFRAKNNINQTQLADMVGLSQSMISAYESGARNISLEKLCYLMAGLEKKVVLQFENVSTEADEKSGTDLFPADPNPITNSAIA